MQDGERAAAGAGVPARDVEDRELVGDVEARVGSSRKSQRAAAPLGRAGPPSWQSTRAICTRCCSPPESCWKSRALVAGKVDRGEASSDDAPARRGASIRRRRWPSTTISKTVNGKAT